MSNDARVAGSIPASPEPEKEKPALATERRPTKALPTDRVGFTKQLDILRGFAALASQGVAAPTNPAVAELVGIHRNTAILTNPFFTEVGLLSRAGDGHNPSQEVMAYGKAYHWNAETAPQKLAPAFRRSWFAQAILPALQLRPLEERKALELIAAACSAAPKYEPQLKTLLQYLAVAGIIRREGDMIRAEHVHIEEEAEAVNAGDGSVAVKDAPTKETASRPAAVSTAFAQVPEGVLRFSVDVNVDLREFASWKPERINAFWAGIAQVLAAKAAVEAGSKG